MGTCERAECNRSSDGASRRPNPWVDAGKDLSDDQRRIRGEVCTGRAAFDESDGDVSVTAQISIK